MAAVPQRTLNWLYGVLTRDHHDPRLTYQDPNRTYHDVANALAQYPSIAPRTEVYTYETGFSALLLQLSGTLPVSFRGTVYRFPVTLWIPNTYPREPPIVYVTPTQDMAVRVGQHVTLEGMVYHHYLAHWAEAWERSSLVDFLLILREVFAKEPPVRYKQQPLVQQRPPLSPQVQAPPPLPPLPPELESSPRRSVVTQGTSVAPTQRPAQVPPPPPPKPGQTPDPECQSQRSSTAGRYNSPPPLPPLPPKEQDLRRLSFQQQSSINIPGARPSQYPPEQSSIPLQPTTSQYQHPQHAPPPASEYLQGQAYAQSLSNAPIVSLQDFGRMPHQPVPAQMPPRQTPLPHSAHSQRLPHPGPTQPLPRYQHQQPLPAQQQQRPKSETPDLLTSPFELELPSFTPTGPAPPIPPNPEKDALLQAVSKTLSETLQTNIAQSETAAHSLLSQSHSLHAAIATLQGEISSLNTLNATLQSNTSILQHTLHRADGVIGDAQTRISSLSGAPSSSTSDATTAASGLPPIDEVLVAPTVVGKQLYDLVAEERGIQQAIYALQAALVKGVIGVETWSRHTRGLAREAFLKRALIRKIGKGMGLEVEEVS
ncbi:UEV-domain-containing protein [Aspergillus japonicus CBS 114.51]|uniref:UEV-domain-containing protein n=2 Tax=Aspergillus TaxID=5052 RepID=A0A2V5I2R0_ASPV1|nr:UEV-domain-containing protein [Aspergillus japonicus CBS 114.51]PYI22800.1 UEV-domain-containing protein [Aspergillus violaceofuscus CBS 115571]RAH80653.1 UEV-domain-containing protein [Aspergillus japonicus CBS 114.51]